MSQTVQKQQSETNNSGNPPSWSQLIKKSSELVNDLSTRKYNKLYLVSILVAISAGILTSGSILGILFFVSLNGWHILRTSNENSILHLFFNIHNYTIVFSAILFLLHFIGLSFLIPVLKFGILLPFIALISIIFGLLR